MEKHTGLPSSAPHLKQLYLQYEQKPDAAQDVETNPQIYISVMYVIVTEEFVFVS